MAKPIISAVNNNTERRDNYRIQIERYNKAMENEFYFESLVIVYALLEDRMKSFLYYCGVFENRNTLSCNPMISNEIKEIVYGGEKEKTLPILKNISLKIQYIRAIIEWSAEVFEKDIRNSEYLVFLKRQLESVDIGGIIDILDNLSDGKRGWLRYRNEIIHALMNKNQYAVNSNISSQIRTAMEYVRFIDNQVRIIKKDNIVRKTLNLNCE